MVAKFGTSGLRGLASELTGVPSALYTTAFCRHLIASGKVRTGDAILVGQDFRASSPEIAATCMGAIAAEGFKPVDCGTVPTPALARYGLELGAASLMVTGSHIPADRNGIKFYLPEGEISKIDELAITDWAQKLDGTVVPSTATGEDHAEATKTLFLGRLKQLLPPDALLGMRVGVYQHSTVARDLLVEILQYYGAVAVPLGWSDHFIPVDTEAVSEETLGLLETWSRNEPLHAIVSADGDGDRPLVADEAGRPLRGDLLGLITAGFLKADVLVTPVTSNSGIERGGDFEVIRTQVGSPYVIAGIEDALGKGKSAIVGFEANGGFLTGTAFAPVHGEIRALPTRDSFLPILAALCVAKSAGQPLSAMADQFNMPSVASDRIQNYAQERSGALMAHLRGSDANLSAFLAPVGTIKSHSDIDGLRMTLADDRIIHFRPSGNAPEMRCYVEAETDEAAAQLLAQGLALLDGFKG